MFSNIYLCSIAPHMCPVNGREDFFSDGDLTVKLMITNDNDGYYLL